MEAEDAYNFALYSRHATGVTLLCYAEEDPASPIFEFRFRHPTHKTGNVWHCGIPASELRGAALGLPRPIDALELALAAVEVVGRAMP